MTIEEMRSNAEKLKELNKNLDEAVAELEVSGFFVSAMGWVSVSQGEQMLFRALGTHCQAGLMIPKFRNVWLLSSYPHSTTAELKNVFFGEEKYLLKFFKWNNCNCKQSAAAGCCP